MSTVILSFVGLCLQWQLRDDVTAAKNGEDALVFFVMKQGGDVRLDDKGLATVVFEKADDAVLLMMPEVERIVSLTLSNTGITDKGGRRLKDFSRLEEIDLSYTRITDTSLVFSPKANLRHINVGQTNITGSFLVNLDLTQLGTLEMFYCKAIDAKWLNAIGKGHRIHTLDLQACGILGKDMGFLASCKELKVARLGFNDFKSIPLAMFKSLSKLTYLSVSGTSLSDEAISFLIRQNEDLTDVYITSTRAAEKSFGVIRAMTKLRRLAISDAALPNPFIEALSKNSTHLQEVSFINCTLEKGDLKFLSNSPLELLNLQGTKVSDAEVFSFRFERPKVIVVK